MKNNVVNDKKICVTLQQFKDFFLTHNYNDNMFNSDGSINTKYNSNKKTSVIAQIFEKHWVKFYIENKIMVETYRTNAPFEIQKVIDCHNKDLGCNAYKCPNCHDVIFVGNNCKFRLCTPCDYKYKNARVESILQHAMSYFDSFLKNFLLVIISVFITNIKTKIINIP